MLKHIGKCYSSVCIPHRKRKATPTALRTKQTLNPEIAQHNQILKLGISRNNFSHWTILVQQ